MRINDRGSRQQHVDVSLGGVPARGAIDSGRDITIIEGGLVSESGSSYPNEEAAAPMT